MKRILYRFLILSVAAVSLCACQKDPDVQYEAQGEESQILDAACSHSDMIFISREEPNATSYGWAEHYRCPDCGGYFSDAAGTTPMENVVVWGSELNVENTLFIEEFSEIYDGLIDCVTFEEGDDESIGQKILEWLKKSVMDKIGDVFKKILSVFHSWGKEPPKPSTTDLMKGILEQLRNVERAINELCTTLGNLDEKNMMIERERKVFYLFNATHPSFMAMLNELEGVTTESDITPQKKENIRKIVSDWYDKGIYNGAVYEDCYITVCNLMHFFSGYVASKSFPVMYDAMIATKTPWLHEQEPIKYLVRITDVLTLTEGYIMMALHLSYNPSDTSNEKLKQMSSELLRYYQCLDSSPVPHDRKGFHEWTWADKTKKSRLDEFYLNDTMWKYDGMSKKYDEIYNQHLIWKEENTIKSLWEACHPDQNEISIDEARVIYEYSKTAYGTNSIYEALEKAGFKGVVGYKNHGRLVCWDGKNWHRSLDGTLTYMNFQTSRLMNRIYFSNCVSETGFSINTPDNAGYNNVTWREGVRWMYYGEHKPLQDISDPGKPTSNVFQALTHPARTKYN